MTDRLTPERLATIRNNHARDLRLGDEYRLQADNEDLGDLLGEIDRLTADREQLIAAILRLKQEPRIPLEAWYAYATVLEMARGTKVGLRDETADDHGEHRQAERAAAELADAAEALNAAVSRAQRAEAELAALRRAIGSQWPQGDAQAAPQRVAGASGMDFPTEGAAEPLRAPEGFGSYRCPTSCDDDCEARCHEGHEVSYKQRHDVAECQARSAGAEAYRRVLRSARRMAPRLIDDMIADARAEIAPEDEGIATSDVQAQTAADQRMMVGSYPAPHGNRTVASDQCPRCRADNTEPWSLCADCADNESEQQ